MPRPNKQCPVCLGKCEVRMMLQAGRRMPRGMTQLPMMDCRKCNATGEIPVTDADLLDLIWDRLQER